MSDALWRIEKARKKDGDFYNVEIIEENLNYEEAIDKVRKLNYSKEGYISYRVIRTE